MKRSINRQNKYIQYVDMVLLTLLLLYCFFLTALPLEMLSIAYKICFNLILVVSYFSIGKTHRQYAGYLIFLAILGYWISYFFDYNTLAIISSLLLGVAFVNTVINLLRQVASEKSVSQATLIQAISGYLLIGVMFSLMFNLIIRLDPASMNFSDYSDHPSANPMGDSLYYTFISLATVGYGDFLPVSPIARSMAGLVGITGQMYIATIIAMLIGKYSSK